VWAWYEAVYEAVQEIPRGRVTSYGHIAKLLGKPECPRQVGVCLKHLPSPSSDASKPSARWHSGNVPWQRVINSKGCISPRYEPPSVPSKAEIRHVVPIVHACLMRLLIDAEQKEGLQVLVAKRPL